MSAATTSILRALVVDDHRLMLAAVRRALSRSHALEVVAEVDDATKVVPAIRDSRPDVVLLDVRMPRLDGLTCLERIQRMYPDVAVVVLSTFDDEEHLAGARERGARGYIVKTVEPASLADMVVEAVRSPEFVVFRPDPRLTGQVFQDPHGLSDRELAILRALARGLTNREIGRDLWLSEDTVKFHLRNIYRKLGLTSRIEAVRYTISHGLASTAAPGA
jgi:DNA-binding NarL/FixJ family response regulator